MASRERSGAHRSLSPDRERWAWDAAEEVEEVGGGVERSGEVQLQLGGLASAILVPGMIPDGIWTNPQGSKMLILWLDLVA